MLVAMNYACFRVCGNQNVASGGVDSSEGVMLSNHPQGELRACTVRALRRCGSDDGAVSRAATRRPARRVARSASGADVDLIRKPSRSKPSNVQRRHHACGRPCRDAFCSAPPSCLQLATVGDSSLGDIKLDNSIALPSSTAIGDVVYSAIKVR